MCGICGIIRFDEAAIEGARVEKMRDAMAARGPDGAGYLSGPRFAFAHRRLSILELSERGAQPMQLKEFGLTITYNGEIYNHLELRRALEAEGAKFQSRSDTEVLLWGYALWGMPKLLKKIAGMYSFALADTQKKKFFLARDALGKKPLFYRLRNHELVFASSVSALLQGFSEIPEVDREGVKSLLWNLYIPGPRTIYESVQKLRPGHYLELSGNGEFKLHPHFELNFDGRENSRSHAEWVSQFEESFTRAVSERLEADVPVGVLLSGGVDSSVLAAFAKRKKENLKTFSVKANDPRWDESKYSRRVAQHLNTDHKELAVGGDELEAFSKLIQDMAEPLADPSLFQVFRISQLAREHVKVVLTGDGGDELFGGYQHLWGQYQAERWNWVLKSIPRHFLLRMSEALRKTKGSLGRLGTFLFYASAPEDQLLDRFSHLQREIPELASNDHYHQALLSAKGGTRLERLMAAQYRTILADDYLPKVDYGTMAASLEARSPFMDRRLIEEFSSMPSHLRFLHNEPKGFLRQIARKLLPRECVDRPKKGFVTPVANWLRGSWKDFVYDSLNSQSFRDREIFRPEVVDRILSEHEDGVDHGYLIWSLLILDSWLLKNENDFRADEPVVLLGETASL